MESQFNNAYLLYKVSNKGLFAAVSQVFARLVRQYAMEYQGLPNVPPGKTICAVMFRPMHDNLYEVVGQGMETEIPVNQLEFDTGDLRLIA